MPITFPFVFIKGPPELPGLRAASVCIYAGMLFTPSLFLPETMPSETENDNPKGFPIAITFSPITVFFISSNSRNLYSPSIFNNAISNSSSYPIKDIDFISFSDVMALA